MAPLILFDGVCNLCHAAVQWIVKRDRSGRFRFAPLQSEAARAALGGRMDSLPDSIVLIDEAGMHTESEAAIRIATQLGFPYSLARAGRMLPRAVRDAAYRWIARNRYRWFGKREACALPQREL
jgi:predicted DCC family thiol-disulfide oxidoreductase YuxK